MPEQRQPRRHEARGKPECRRRHDVEERRLAVEVENAGERVVAQEIDVEKMLRNREEPRIEADTCCVSRRPGRQPDARHDAYTGESERNDGPPRIRQVPLECAPPSVRQAPNASNKGARHQICYRA